MKTTTAIRPFMRALLRGLPEGHHTALWRQDTEAHEWVTDPAEAVAYTEEADSEGGDVYVAQAFWPADHRRRTNEDAAGLFALALDLDVNGSPERDGSVKQGAAPSILDAVRLSYAVAPPTIIVSTGGGVQPWWLFDDPWLFSSDDDRDRAGRLAKEWQTVHAARVPWRIDSTADLARVRRALSVAELVRRRVLPAPSFAGASAAEA